VIFLADNDKFLDEDKVEHIYIKVQDLEQKGYFRHLRRRTVMGLIKFQPLVHQAKQRAIDRLYRPGGQGYLQAKEHFESTANLFNQPC